ncbi:MAG: head-tail joining protein [Caulobacteraceae bacterium]
MIDWDKYVLGPVMAVFGEAGAVLPTYRPASGAPFPLADVVYDEAYFGVDLLQDGTTVTSARPIIGVRLALFATAPKQSDKIFIPRVNSTFVVKEVEPDGHGHAKLTLQFVSSP